VAVTKGWPAEVVRAALAAGLTRFGETRIQEAEPKIAALPELDWHLVGLLQSNKARRAVRLFGTIHSVDSLELLERLERVAGEERAAPSVLLQVDLAGAKAGFAEPWLAAQVERDGELVRLLRELRALHPAGLMTIGSLGEPEAAARRRFARLRTLRDALAERLGRPLPELSMGMSEDADAAVAEGATLVRIGTAIFGPRRA